MRGGEHIERILGSTQILLDPIEAFRARYHRFGLQDEVIAGFAGVPPLGESWGSGLALLGLTPAV